MSLVEKERQAGDLLYRLLFGRDEGLDEVIGLCFAIAERNPDVLKSSMYVRGKEVLRPPPARGGGRTGEEEAPPPASAASGGGRSGGEQEGTLKRPRPPPASGGGRTADLPRFYLLMVLSYESELQQFFISQSNPAHPGNQFGKPDQLRAFYTTLADMREMTLNFACHRGNIETVVKNFVQEAKKYYVGVN